MTGKIVHWEIMGPDGDALNAFYSELFGWSGTAVAGMDGYHLVDADQAGVGGAVGQSSDEIPNYVTVYIEVDDADEYLTRAIEGGGSLVMPRTEVAGTVTFGLFRDPAGNMVGVVEAEVPPAD